MSDWISVKERLPKEAISPITHDLNKVLCATTFGDVRVYGYGKPYGDTEPHFWNGCGIMDEYVTHWMPFPDMPTADHPCASQASHPELCG